MGAGETDPLDSVHRAHGPEQVGEQRAQRHRLTGLSALPLKIAAVGVDVLAQQSDLGDPAFDELGGLVHQQLQGSADLGAPHRGHDAEGARVVTAHLDGHPRRIRGVAAHRQCGGEAVAVVLDRRFQNFDDGPVGRGSDQFRGPMHVVGAEHHVYVVGPLLDQIPVFLGQTAGHRDLHVGALLLEPL